jgi:hypothetical protein
MGTPDPRGWTTWTRWTRWTRTDVVTVLSRACRWSHGEDLHNRGYPPGTDSVA